MGILHPEPLYACFLHMLELKVASLSLFGLMSLDCNLFIKLSKNALELRKKIFSYMSRQ